MDKYLTIFTEQLDTEFKTETLFQGKNFSTRGWVYQKFNISKYRKRLPKRSFPKFETLVNTKNAFTTNRLMP